MTDKLLHKHITDKTLRAFYNVYNALGPGFLEKVRDPSHPLKSAVNFLTSKKSVEIRRIRANPRFHLILETQCLH